MQHAVRDTSRGGRELFSWEEVRLMSYKDREQYLGGTVKLGYLDKGGKWRKRDWWQKGKESNEKLKAELAEERKLLRKKEQHEIMKKL